MWYDLTYLKEIVVKRSDNHNRRRTRNSVKLQGPKRPTPTPLVLRTLLCMYLLPCLLPSNIRNSPSLSQLKLSLNHFFFIGKVARGLILFLFHFSYFIVSLILVNWSWKPLSWRINKVTYICVLFAVCRKRDCESFWCRQLADSYNNGQKSFGPECSVHNFL